MAAKNLFLRVENIWPNCLAWRALFRQSSPEVRLHFLLKAIILGGRGSATPLLHYFSY